MTLAGHWGYFDGSDTKPISKDPANPTDAKISVQKQWNRNDTIAQCLLNQHLPDELAMDMEKYPTVKEQWDVISALFMAKSKVCKDQLVSGLPEYALPKRGQCPRVPHHSQEEASQAQSGRRDHHRTQV